MPCSQPQTPSRDDALTDAQTGLPNRVHASVVLETGWALALRGNGLAVVMLELGRHGPSGSLLTPEATEHAVQTLACILVDRTRRMDLRARFSAGRFIVVLVDDDQSVVGSLQRLFRRVGYAKPAGISDLRLVEEYVRNAHMDLIILDLHIPELDGFLVLVSLAPALAGGIPAGTDPDR